MNTIVLPIIKQILPELTARDIIDAQPMFESWSRLRELDKELEKRDE